MNQEHLDAEIVAGWADGSLDQKVRAAAEAHAADCQRCQAVLAAMVRTEPIAAASKPAWFRSPLRWALPLATAAAALTLWVAVSRDAQTPAAPQVASRAESPATDVDRPSPVEPAAPPAQPQPAAARKREPEAASPQAAGRATAPFAAGSGRKSVVAQRPLPTVADTATRAEPLPRVEELRRDAFTGGRSTLPPAAAPSPAQTAQQAQPAGQQQQQVEIRTQSAARSRARAVLADSVSVLPLREFASPDVTARWRIGAGGAIEHSADGGGTWTPQKSGVTTELVAASAPSNTICWIVGRSGVVLVSTDAATWRRVPFPVTTDLRAVTASDARTAAVTTADGRVFRTIDGGFNWGR